MDGVFVTGTDTDVGKTVISGGLLKLLYGSRQAVYWKPIQTGTIVGDDTRDLKEITQLPSECFAEPLYSFPDALSPHLAAAQWKKEISVDALCSTYGEYKKERKFMVVEGAGGVLVPINEKDLLIRVIKLFKLPVLVVSEDRLGAINQTLLTLNALRDQDIAVLGVVMTKGRGSFGNAESIAKYGRVEVLAEFAVNQDHRAQVSQVSCHSGLRKLFKVADIP